MLRIGDFSQIGQISVRMLRHYDKLGLLTPDHVDVFTGYRYYEIDQLPRLHRILALRDLGLSLEQVNTLLTEEALPESHLQEMLQEKKREVEAELRDEEARLRRIDAHLRRLARQDTRPAYEVALKKMPQQALFGIRRVVPALGDMPVYRDQMLHQLYRLLEIRGLTAGQEVVIYHLQGYEERDIDMSMAVIAEEGGGAAVELLPPFERLILPAAPQAASIVHHGSILEIGDVVSELYFWLGVNGLTSVGPYREIHLFGRELDICAEDISDPVVFEVLVPVERTPAAQLPRLN